MMSVLPPYRDRYHAGVILAESLRAYTDNKETLVLGLARGGVPVGYEIAIALKLPLDVFVVRKLGIPGNEELAMGAIASGGVRVLNPEIVALFKNSEAIVQRVTEQEECELIRREKLYRGDRPLRDLTGKTIILTDDGIATGATVRAAIQALRCHQVARCIVAAPVGSLDTCAELQSEADEVICSMTPEPFLGVGRFYKDFSQTSDEDVCELLRQAASKYSEI